MTNNQKTSSPSRHDGIYLDNNATTAVHPEVLEAMLPYLSDQYGNPSSLYTIGRQARAAVEEARAYVAELIGIGEGDDTGKIIFTGCGTESNNLAIKGVLQSLFKERRNRQKKHIVTTKIEHHSVINTCKWLEEHGYEVTYLPVDNYCTVDPDAVEDAITDNTAIVTIMHSNNEVGTVQPIAEIGRRLREKDIVFHVDAIQSVGKIPVSVKELNCDLLSISAHKIHAQKGIGALYIRKGTKIECIQQGGHQELGMRGGTENVPGIVGFGKAAEIAKRDLKTNIAKLLNLRKRLLTITDKLNAVRLNGHPERVLPGTVNLCILGVDATTLVLNLSMKGVFVSTGSACSAGSIEPSHVLKAMGLSDEAAHSSIRISMGRNNTEAQIDYAIEQIITLAKKLRLITMPEDIGECGDNCPCYFEQSAP